MKVLRDLLTALLLFVLFVISVLGFMANFPVIFGATAIIGDAGRAAINWWSTYTGGMFWTWVGILALFLLRAGIAFKARDRNQSFRIELEHGNVEIRNSAIEKYIRTSLNDMPGFTPRRIKVRNESAGLRVNIQAQVRTRENLPEFEDKVITRVRQALTNDLGVQKIAGIRVSIADIDVRPVPNRTANAAAPVAAAAAAAPVLANDALANNTPSGAYTGSSADKSSDIEESLARVSASYLDATEPGMGLPNAVNPVPDTSLPSSSVGLGSGVDSPPDVYMPFDDTPDEKRDSDAKG